MSGAAQARRITRREVLPLGPHAIELTAGEGGVSAALYPTAITDKERPLGNLWITPGTAGELRAIARQIEALAEAAGETESIAHA